jgi:hypothetical protein
VRCRYLEQSEWLSPTNIDNTGVTNVSKAITDWLADTGQPGDLFKLRSGSYWIPQGIRIAKSLRFDLNGAVLFTGITLGPEDPNLAQNIINYPAPPFDDWSGVDIAGWPASRVAVKVIADDVGIYSSAVGARIQGAARKVVYRGGFTTAPEACEYNPSFEGQHCIRFGYKPAGSFLDRYRLDIDLTNISLEFPSGDGITFMGATHDVVIHGAQAGPAVVDANLVNISGIPYLGANGGLPDGINVGGGGGGAYDLWIPGATGYPGIHHTARQGIATDFDGCSDLTIRDISLWRIGRTAIDLEIGNSFTFPDVTIQRVEFGHWYLGHINQPYDGNCDNVLIEDCISYKQWHIQCATVNQTPRRTNWTIRRNRARYRHGDAGGPPNEALAVDGLTIENNWGIVQSAGGGIDTGTSTSVTINPTEDTQFVPTTLLVSCGAFAGVATAAAKAWNPTGPR